MWKVRKTKRIGVRTLYEVYKEMPTGETIFRGRWSYPEEAQELADKLNKEEAEREQKTTDAV